MQRWIERPEARWALWAGVVAGAIAAAASATKMILSPGASIVGPGLIVVSLVAVTAAVPIALWGAALGHVVLYLRGRARAPKLVFWAAFIAAVSLPAAISWEVSRGRALEQAIVEARGSDYGRDGERLFASSPWRRNKYFLGALAENTVTSAAVLEGIARLEDPELFEPMWSVWNVMGDNHGGEAVMRLVARHANASGATLARLEAHPRAQEVITEILANPNTPDPILAKYFDNTHPHVEWGLARNPKTPPAVMERLARSDRLHARMNLVLHNPATPRAILEQLAEDVNTSTASRARTRLKYSSSSADRER
jgi:hypothetical protein